MNALYMWQLFGL